MKMLFILLIFVIIVFGECEIYRYKRATLLAAACKRYPTLAFCKKETQIKVSTNTLKTLPSKPPSFIPFLTKQSATQPQSYPAKSSPAEPERFHGRLGGGDFDRTDQLEGYQKEGKISNFRKISGRSRPLTGVDSRLSKLEPID
uniref:Uncharacterized protein n=1 Tax=Panagrolaimus sp. PS1159 TaxID=55785 RepID=A0AC35EUA8_9BILA